MTATLERTPDEALPSQQDPVVSGLSEAIGGPVGAHATRRWSWWTPVRIVLALACLTMALHWVQKSPCRDIANWEVGGRHHQYDRLCYSDTMALYYWEKLSDGKVPYRDHPVEYPVLTGAFMGVIGLPIHALGERLGPTFNQGTAFYDVNAIVLGILFVATVAVVLALRRRRPWDAALVALAPGVLLSATVNWDLLAVSLTAFGLLAWARRHPILAGVLLGAAAAAKFYPLFVVIPLVLLGLRSRRFVEATYVMVGGFGTWFLINLPAAALWQDNWRTFYSFSRKRSVDWGTIWYIGDHFPRGKDARGQDVYGFETFHWLRDHVSALNAASAVLFGLCLLGVAALAFLAPRRPRLASLIFLTVAFFLMTNKVWSQQFVLWLIPLAVLARPQWRAFLFWQATEVLYFFGFYMELLAASNQPVVPEGVFIATAIGRYIGLGVFCGFVIRDILRPERDVVRADGVDDPDGGYLDHAEDAPWVKRIQRKLGITSREPAPTAVPVLA